MDLRQLVMVSNLRDPIVESLCNLFDIKVSFNDPGVGHFGLENAVLPIGTDFLEVVSPVEENTTAGRYLDRRGGDGGYMVIIQVDDFSEVQKTIKENNVTVVWESEHPEARAIHLHPKQIGGSILSLDSMIPQSAWLWAGTNWENDIQQSLVDSLMGVVLQSPKPEKLCASWEVALGKKRARGVDEFFIALEKSKIKFIKEDDARGEGINAFILSTRKPDVIYKRAEERGLIKSNSIALGGTNFILSRTDNI